MSQLTALLDANVLYLTPVRDILMQLAIEDMFRAKWTADIHHEWIEALLSFHLIDLKNQSSRSNQSIKSNGFYPPKDNLVQGTAFTIRSQN